MEFGVEVGCVHTSVISDCAYLSATEDELPENDVDILKVGVKSLTAKNLA